ncbi:hypothetical protein GW17_00047573, partial [Ensete ventricosum]
LLGVCSMLLRIMLHHLMVMVMERKHTTSIAAGNHGIPVIVSGHHFGNASGMAPHAQ